MFNYTSTLHNGDTEVTAIEFIKDMKQFKRLLNFFCWSKVVKCWRSHKMADLHIKMHNAVAYEWNGELYKICYVTNYNLNIVRSGAWCCTFYL